MKTQKLNREEIFAPGRLVHVDESRNLAIRNLSAEDLHKGDVFFSQARPMMLDRWLSDMEQEKSVFLVARMGSRYAGSCALDADPYKKYEAAFICFLYVLPKKRGSGVGGTLVDSAIRVVRDLSISAVELLVHSDEGMDSVAKRLYLRKGFEEKAPENGFGELMIRRV
jgi:GNAT superfamily N-acetyltransferase